MAMANGVSRTLDGGVGGAIPNAKSQRPQLAPVKCALVMGVAAEDGSVILAKRATSARLAGIQQNSPRLQQLESLS